MIIFDVANILILYKFFFDKFFWEFKKKFQKKQDMSIKCLLSWGLGFLFVGYLALSFGKRSQQINEQIPKKVLYKYNFFGGLILGLSINLKIVRFNFFVDEFEFKF